jgi:predicted naringenin-chalcone synthase
MASTSTPTTPKAFGLEAATRSPEAERATEDSMNVVLSALATANPQRYATQEEIYAFLVSHFPMQPQERELYRQILLEGPIQGRHIAVDVDEEICSQDPDCLVARFATHSRRLAAAAARTALEQASLRPTDIDGLVVNTCTGYLCPGLSSYVIEDVGLPAFTSILDLMGMGCGGAIPNLEAACRMIQAGAKRMVLCLSIEVCSATFFLGPDPDLVISNSIFADGASAAILVPGVPVRASKARVEGVPPSSRGHELAPAQAGDARDTTPYGVTTDAPVRTATAAGRSLVQFVDFESVTLPEHREQLRYTSQGGRLRNVLTRNVPVIGAKAVAQVVQRLLERRGLTRNEIDWWVVHPGGTQVLTAVERHLGLAPERLRFSYEVFRQYGNMSSPSVMFVLDRILRTAKPEPGSRGLLLSFGAGFTAFAALVEF